MVQLTEESAPPHPGSFTPHPSLPHHPPSITQPQQLTANTTTTAAQLGRVPLNPSAATPQLASNGTQKTASTAPPDHPDARNGFTETPLRGSGRKREQEQEAGISRKGREDSQGHHVRLRRDFPSHPDGSLPQQERWSYYGDPRVRTDRQAHPRQEQHRRWSRDDEGGRWPPRDRRTPLDTTSTSRSVAFQQTEDGRSDGGEGAVGDRGETTKRRPPPSPRQQDRPRTLPQAHRHHRDRERERHHDRDRERDNRGRERHTREREHDRDREGDGDRDRGQQEEREHNRNRNRERERDDERDNVRGGSGNNIRDRERERERHRDRELDRDRHYWEPRRREPVGEETGYDSDHSRLSRATAVSYSSRSLPRRPRADSVTSHASHASRASRTPRGYEDMYEQYHQYYQYNQYYKDYYQWMKQYRQAYQSESFYDDRTSIHSGRSSVNNEAEKSVSSPFLQDFHSTSALGHFEPSPIYPEGSLSRLKSYPSGDLSGVPSVADEVVASEAQRMTPAHFGRPHISASFAPTGQIVLVLPKDPRDGEKAVVQLRDVQKMLCVDPSESRAITQLKDFPGPLTLSDTHKDVVMRHCEHKAAEAARSSSLPDKESVILIWEYLALLVKQNGKLFGSDIAVLLLKGREAGSGATHSGHHPEALPDLEATDNSPQDEGVDLPSAPLARDEAALLKKFTEYLCLGRKKEAVDYAMQEGLWGHALALAYKMDSTTHTRVLAAFTSHIPHTDVVFTLFQQLSGKKPDITKSYSPEQWGDWRQHLAVMISNPTGAALKDSSSIVALGDTLAAQGRLHAAHFCYLVAGVEWGTYACKDSKLVLIGASHHLPFQAFATAEAMQCTEVYEFARSLDDNNSPSLDTFQSYKLIYALRLTECGFPAEALRYCEVISQAVEKSPTSYKVEFLSQVYEFALRLKYYDLHYQMYQGEVSEIPDPQWLNTIRDILDLARQREHEELLALRAGSQQDTHMHSYMYQQDQDQGFGQGTEAQNQTDSIQNHSEPHSMSYGAPSQPYRQPDTAYTTQASPDVIDSSGSPQQLPSHGADASPVLTGMNVPQEEGFAGVDTSTISQPSPEHTRYPQDTSGYPQAPYQQQDPYLQPTSQPPGPYELGTIGGQQQQQQQQQGMSGEVPSYQGYPPQQQQQPYQSWAPPPLPPQPPQLTEEGSASPQPDSGPPDFPAPQIQTQPQTQTQRTPEEEAYWAEMSNKKSESSSNNNNNNNSSSKTEASSKGGKAEEEKKSSTGKENKSSGSSKGGWFSSLLGWKSSTPQAVLPDDKNPKIVWDEKNKTWVNTDGSEETTTAVGPPPKIPQSIRGPLPSVSRTGGRMTRYVDPMRDKAGAGEGSGSHSPGAPMIQPPMPIPSHSPSLMMPQSMPIQPSQEDATDPANRISPSQQPQQQPLSPGPAPAPVPEVAQATLNEEEPRGAVPMMSPPMGQPQFFDPSQFKPPPSSPPNPARRAGPGRRSFPANR